MTRSIPFFGTLFCAVALANGASATGSHLVSISNLVIHLTSTPAAPGRWSQKPMSVASPASFLVCRILFQLDPATEF